MKMELSNDTREIIEEKLRDKRLEILIELGFVSRGYSNSKLPVPEYKLETLLWTPEVVEKVVNKFNELKSNVKDWFPLGDVDENAVKQVVEEFITSEIKPKSKP